MTLLLIILSLNIVAELLLWTKTIWHIRKPFSILIIASLTVINCVLVGKYLSVVSIAILLVSVYRMVNLLRLIEGRTHADYLYQVASRSSLLLVGLQVILIVLDKFIKFNTPINTYLIILAAINLAAALSLLISALINLRRIKAVAPTSGYADKDLPSLSVALPARNETEDLKLCLSSLLESDYPKLEIIVLDDCSQNKNTSEIIKQFAHSGVRFISGKLPPEKWVAKTFAYQQLSEQCSGEIILFCGVDARFEPSSLKQMVELMVENKKSMISFMPKNKALGLLDEWKSVIQANRYAWEIALPRKLLNRPPVLSTCWLIRGQELNKLGGFNAVAHNVSPESYFAREINKIKGAYSFYKSDQASGLTSSKSFKEQKYTSIRTRYPQTHRRPEIVGLMSSLELLIFISPYALIVYGLISRNYNVVVISACNVVILAIFYDQILKATFNRYFLFSIFLVPLAAVYDTVLLNYSMWLYEFREVLWKGRNVCLPVMKVIRSLPEVK